MLSASNELEIRDRISDPSDPFDGQVEMVDSIVDLRRWTLRDRAASDLVSARSTATDKEAHMTDPTATDPDKYKVIFENDRVRVLEYRDEPGQKTSPHEHPDSVMYTLSSFERRLIGANGESREVALDRGEVRWLDAQTHSGENIGSTPTHVLFVELKELRETVTGGKLGPS